MYNKNQHICMNKNEEIRETSCRQIYDTENEQVKLITTYEKRGFCQKCQKLYVFPFVKEKVIFMKSSKK